MVVIKTSSSNLNDLKHLNAILFRLVLSHVVLSCRVLSCLCLAARRGAGEARMLILFAVAMASVVIRASNHEDPL